MSCLFNSLSFFVNDSSYNIRQKICDYLQSNQKIIDGLETSHILSLESQNYIQNMRSMSTWGGAIEIQAACNLYMARIIVNNHTSTNSKIEFIPINSGYDKTFELCWTGGHYEPVRNQ